jgi:hypothetical protein
MSTDLPTTRRTDDRPTTTTTTTTTADRRTAREERESRAPVCPDIGSSWVSSRRRVRQELTLVREQLERIEHRMDMEMEGKR